MEEMGWKEEELTKLVDKCFDKTKVSKEEKEEALNYLVHGKQLEYDKTKGLVLPDYIRVIDGDRP